MKIVLINPPSLYLQNDAAYPPMGLLYLATPLENANHDVNILDLTGNPQWQTKVQNATADLFGLTCTTPNFNIVKEIINLLSHKTPKIIGGVHPTFKPSDFNNFKNCIIVRGEADDQIIENIKLCDAIARTQTNIIINNDLTLKFNKPARHLVDLHKYTPGGENCTPVYTSRGCPYNCVFCSKITDRSFRSIPIPQIIEEIKEVQNLGFNNIVFGDDNIAANPHHLKRVLSAIKPLDIAFRLNMDSRHVTTEILNLAKEAGCIEISMGIESGSQTILNAMNKQTTVTNNTKTIQKIKSIDITVKAYFMVNFPGETDWTIMETINFIRKTKPDKCFLSTFAPLPGSPIFDNPEQYGINWMSPNWSDYYLAGKEFKHCFTAKNLDPLQQEQNYNNLNATIRSMEIQ
jgi:radical SAM superfamily enzyme YgiQ (UPF0313 family)